MITSKLKKLAIVYHDNDFYWTFRGVLINILLCIKGDKKVPIDKEKLLTMINNMSIGMYLSWQNPMEYSTDPTSIEGVRQHIKLDSIERILINEEVDEYVKNTEWNNSETFILDTELVNDPIFTI